MTKTELSSCVLDEIRELFKEYVSEKYNNAVTIPEKRRLECSFRDFKKFVESTKAKNEP